VARQGVLRWSPGSRVGRLLGVGGAACSAGWRGSYGAALSEADQGYSSQMALGSPGAVCGLASRFAGRWTFAPGAWSW
jgi:hypothetical protein